MNIKSLLLGSAAALVAVSGARAADAVEVVAEPEPMEYVRVCDTYYKRARFALQVDARSETELGTLRGYAQVNFDWDTYRIGNDSWAGGAPGEIDDTGTDTKLNHAYIELGGFRIGKTDSLFTTFTNYAGGVINDDFAVPFGPYDTHQIVYTFNAGNGFTAAVGLEEGTQAYTIDSYIPHVVAGVGYTGGWGGVRDSAADKGLTFHKNWC